VRQVLKLVDRDPTSGSRRIRFEGRAATLAEQKQDFVARHVGL